MFYFSHFHTFVYIWIATPQLQWWIENLVNVPGKISEILTDSSSQINKSMPLYKSMHNLNFFKNNNNLFIRVYNSQPEREYNVFTYSCFLFIYVTSPARLYAHHIQSMTLTVPEV